MLNFCIFVFIIYAIAGIFGMAFKYPYASLRKKHKR